MTKKKPIIRDCRECSNFRWDFEVGRFLCEKAEERQVEDLHLVPDWCPLAESIWTNVSGECLDAKCF